MQYDKSGVPGSLVGNIPDAPTVTYTYMSTDDKLRLQSYSVSNGMGNETFGYDSYKRLNQVTQTFAGRESYSLVRTYTWDTLDRMQKLTYPMRHGTSDLVRREMTLTYDIASRIDSLKYDDAQTGQVFASNPVYNAASQTESLTIGSPTVGSRLTENYTYDAKTGLLTTQKVTRVSDSAVFLDLKYNYTLNNDAQNNGVKTGQLTSITDNQNQARNRAYEYDKLGRLKKVKGGVGAFYAPDWWQDYAYDRYGNRTGVTKTGGGSNIPLDGLASLGFNTASNRVTSTNFEYDPAGNQTKAVVDAGGAVQQYRYDAAGRLAQVLNGSGGVLATYSYGASNQRLMSVEGAITTYYGWDGGRVIAEYAPSGASGLLWQTGYVYLGGRLLATMSGAAGSGTRFHHPDRLGTNVVTDQSNGELVTKQMGMPYGTQQPMGAFGGDNSWQHPSKGNPSKKRFTSYDRSDATGLDYAVNRFYSAAQGRFTQVDPIGMSAASLSDPQSLNMYSYCGNDPINYVDPDGLFFKKLFGWIGKVFKWIAIAAAIAIAVLTIIPGAWAGTVLAKLSIWAAKHQILASLLGLHTPQWAIINLVSTAGATAAGATAAGFWVMAGVGAVSSFVQAQKKDQDPNAITPEMTAILNTALDDAEKALRRAKCKKLIAGPNSANPRQLLKDMRSKDGGIELGKLNVAGRTSGKGKGASITFDTYTIGRDPSVGFVVGEKQPYQYADGVTQRQARAVLVLHELSHATGALLSNNSGYHYGNFGGEKLPGDNPFSGVIEANRRIYEACVK